MSEEENGRGWLRRWRFVEGRTVEKAGVERMIEDCD